MKPVLQHRSSGGGTVREVNGDAWRMEIPPGPAGVYRWAQMDDYLHLPRRQFAWKLNPAAALRLELRARVSAAGLPGTWGFGLWNDPFSASLGVGGTSPRLPALPNAAWFFYAGPPNYLAFRDTHPAQDYLAATFSSPRIPSLLLAPAGLAAPLALLPRAARLLRRAASLLIREDAARIAVDPVEWHAYQIDWRGEMVSFAIDGEPVFSTPVSPLGRLGLVIWLDNQYAAFPPNGRLLQGTSINSEAAWLEVEGIQVQ